MHNKKLIELLSKHLPESERKGVIYLEGLLNQQDPLVNIVVFGSYNAGKSSLLNSLTNQLENEYFPTADVPQTRVNKTFEMDNVCFIDTPGLDVNDDDTQQAEMGSLKGDVVIFVHKLTSGSLQQHDLDAMKAVYQQHGDSSSVLFVVTACEGAKPDDDIVKELKHQIGEHLSPDIPISLVSNTLYKRGIIENKPKFVEFSNVEQLRQNLNETVTSVSACLEAKRTKRLHNHYASYLNVIKARRILLEKEKQQYAEREKTFVSAVQKLKQDISKQLKQIQAL
ncbi:GTPase [Vibrio sp. 10N.261.46.A3]|uniref:GTPase n=1 Tax=Vibrio sp. 10N.261.46.A3 TaxID=3229658 RepID=UPI0035524616